VTPTRCDHLDHGLGCARSSGHAGAHWMTGNPAAARADLLRQGWFGQTEWVRRAQAGTLPAKALA
jgi:hypothetical protein